MLDRFDQYLLDAGYGRLQTPGKESIIYFQSQGTFTSVVHFMYVSKDFILTPAKYVEIRKQIVGQFQEKGFEEVHILALLLSEEMENLETIIKENEFSWIIDQKNNCLIIPQGHVEDFYGMKRVILSCLEDKKPLNKQPLNKRPLVNYGIVAVNIVLFFLCLVTGNMLYEKGMMYPRDIIEMGKWYQIFTCMFLHSDVDHIFGNMILLFLLGNIAEKHFGHIKYFIIYMVSGIAGNLFSLWYSYVLQDFVPSLGASGAVYGMVGAFLWILLCNKGRVGEITISRYIFVFAYSLYLGFTSTNIDNVAHVGGLVAGLLLGIMLYRKKKEGNL